MHQKYLLFFLAAIQKKKFQQNLPFLSICQVKASRPGKKVAYTPDPKDKRYIPEAMRKYFADVLNLNQFEDPILVIKEAKDRLRSGRSEADMRKQISTIYSELKP